MISIIRILDILPFAENAAIILLNSTCKLDIINRIKTIVDEFDRERRQGSILLKIYPSDKFLGNEGLSWISMCDPSYSGLPELVLENLNGLISHLTANNFRLDSLRLKRLQQYRISIYFHYYSLLVITIF